MLKCPNCVWYKYQMFSGGSSCTNQNHIKGVTRDCEDFKDKTKYKIVKKE